MSLACAGHRTVNSNSVTVQQTELLLQVVVQGRTRSFRGVIKHSLYPDNRLPWSQSGSEAACKPRSPDFEYKLLLMLPLCPFLCQRVVTSSFSFLPTNSCTSQTALYVTLGLLELKG